MSAASSATSSYRPVTVMRAILPAGSDTVPAGRAGPRSAPCPVPENSNRTWLTRRCAGLFGAEVIAMEATEYDVGVVGGGAAGLSAALVLGRARRRVAVIDAGAPRNAPAAHLQGFLSRDGMAPAGLLATGRAEISGYDVELVQDEVVSIAPGFNLRLAGGRMITARRVLVATGIRDE